MSHNSRKLLTILGATLAAATVIGLGTHWGHEAGRPHEGSSSDTDLPAAVASAPDVFGTTEPEEADPPGSFRDGSFVVGTDVQPGTYRSLGGRDCYWARLHGFGGDLTDIVANANESGPAIVTISETDKGFESKRCGLWIRGPSISGLPMITEGLSTPFSDGTYVVGTDIGPGTWRADSPESCYWARLRAFGGDMDDVIANANGRGIVRISASDKGFKSNRCGTWSPAGR